MPPQVRQDRDRSRRAGESPSPDRDDGPRATARRKEPSGEPVLRLAPPAAPSDSEALTSRKGKQEDGSVLRV